MCSRSSSWSRACSMYSSRPELNQHGNGVEKCYTTADVHSKKNAGRQAPWTSRQACRWPVLSKCNDQASKSPVKSIALTNYLLCLELTDQILHVLKIDKLNMLQSACRGAYPTGLTQQGRAQGSSGSGSSQMQQLACSLPCHASSIAQLDMSSPCS